MCGVVPQGMSAQTVLVVEGGAAYDVFEVVELTDDVARVRATYLFEIGEELTLRVDREGVTVEVAARVRAHAGPADAPITELELLGDS